jgi:hypothetical protein
MTREEFMRARAIAHHVKTVGVVRCAPAAAEAAHEIPLTVRARHKRASNRLQRGVMRATLKRSERESGEPSVELSRSTRSYDVGPLTDAQNDETDR